MKPRSRLFCLICATVVALALILASTSALAAGNDHSGFEGDAAASEVDCSLTYLFCPIDLLNKAILFCEEQAFCETNSFTYFWRDYSSPYPDNNELPAKENTASAAPPQNTGSLTETDPEMHQAEPAPLADISTPSGYASEVIRLVNVERHAAGLSPLAADAILTQAARVRCGEIGTSFSHTRPDGSSCFSALQQAGAAYSRAGENIAMGQQTPEQVVKAWMDSPGHRANILNSAFTKIGVAVQPSPDAYAGYAWVQLFND